MKEPHYMEIRRGTVTKANEIIQKSRFDLTVQQQKIMLYLISQISPSDDDFKEYEFSIPEFCRTCGIAYNGRSFKELKAAIKEIADKSMWIYIAEKKSRLIRWIATPSIDEGTGTINIKLDENMKPYLLQLKEHFTTYELLWTLNFKSKYTIRLYEYIKSVHYHKEEIYIFICAINELKGVMNAERYKDYKNFKMRALLPAIEEINKCSDEDIQFEEIRQGRRVTEIKFTISPKEYYEIVKLKGRIEDKFDLNQLTIWDRLGE